MLDQSFSSENFLKIFYRENRKGSLSREILGDDYLTIHQKIKDLIKYTKKKRKDEPNSDKSEYETKLEVLNKQKEEALNTLLIDVSRTVNESKFQFELNDSLKMHGKTVYTISNEPANFFAIKQLQINVAKTFKVKQANRHEIAKQLKMLLSDNFPKYVIRTDIKQFYESIPQNKMLHLVEENQLLNYQSRRFIKSIIGSYERTKTVSDKKGIPRGIGISAYLAELFFRDIDNKIKSLPDIVFYARYVDDIVAVFVPKSKDKHGGYLVDIEKTVNSYDLSINNEAGSKTFELNLFDQKPTVSFDFLGYKYVMDKGKFLELRMSDNKVKKYEERLEKSILEYNRKSKYSEKQARKELILRMKFLTGNCHLKNNKKTIKTGIYYSNQIISDDFISKDFNHLNNLRRRYLARLGPYHKVTVDVDKLKNRIINTCDFLKGFENREQHFHNFTYRQLLTITSIWHS